MADNILSLAHGKAATPFSLGFVNHAVSLGRRDGVLQLVYADDRPTPVVLTGRSGAVAKELISRMARRIALRSARH